MSDMVRYRVFVLAQIGRTKNPLGPTTIALVGATAQKKVGLDLRRCEELLLQLRREGEVYCNNGRWWLQR
jgi:hypothetical protein